MLASIAATMIVINVSAEAGVWDGTSASESLSGSGSKDDPYLIQSANDLKYLANMVNGGYYYTAANVNTFAGKYFKQTVDIDLNDKLWMPIGNREKATFQGVYDGDGHEITGLYVGKTTTSATGTDTYPNYRNGLFGSIGEPPIKSGQTAPATLTTDCGIANLTVSGRLFLDPAGHSPTGIGGVVGYINKDGYTGTAKVYITNVVSNVNVTVTGFNAEVAFGAIVGEAYSAVFENVVNNGSVTATGDRSMRHYTGGIVGKASNCEFISCVNNGTVTATCTYVHESAVSSSNSTTKYGIPITLAGGILGSVFYKIGSSYAADSYLDTGVTWSDFNVDFVNCVNTGTVSAITDSAQAKASAGGILSTTYAGKGKTYNNGGFLFENCSNIGTVNCTDTGRSGGIVGPVYTDAEYNYDILLRDCVSSSALVAGIYVVKSVTDTKVNCRADDPEGAAARVQAIIGTTATDDNYTFVIVMVAVLALGTAFVVSKKVMVRAR